MVKKSLQLVGKVALAVLISNLSGRAFALGAINTLDHRVQEIKGRRAREAAAMQGGMGFDLGNIMSNIHGLTDLIRKAEEEERDAARRTTQASDGTSTNSN